VLLTKLALLAKRQIVVSEDLVESYDALARDFDASFWEAMGKHARTVFDSLKSPDAGRILNLACSGGLSSFYFREKYPKAQITGLDVSLKMIELARKRRLEARQNNLEFLRGDFLELLADFPANAFDIATWVWNTEGYSSPQKLFGEVRRVVKPGGQFGVILPLGEAIKGTRNLVSAALSYFPQKMRKVLFAAAFPKDKRHLFKALERTGWETANLWLEEEAVHFSDGEEATRWALNMGAFVGYDQVLDIRGDEEIFRFISGSWPRNERGEVVLESNFVAGIVTKRNRERS